MPFEPLTDIKKVDRAIKLYDAQGHSIADIEEMTGVKKATLCRALKQRIAT
jgi:transposase